MPKLSFTVMQQMCTVATFLSLFCMEVLYVIKNKNNKKNKTEKGNSLATVMVQSYFPIGATNIKIKAVLYLVMSASC